MTLQEQAKIMSQEWTLAELQRFLTAGGMSDRQELLVKKAILIHKEKLKIND